MAYLSRRLAGDVLQLLHLLPGRVRISIDKPLGEVKPHGNGSDRLGGTVVQIASQLLARFLLRLRDPISLLFQAAVASCVLQRGGRLFPHRAEQLQLARIEEIRPRMGEKQHAMNISLSQQRDTGNPACVLQGFQSAQFRIVAGRPE